MAKALVRASPFDGLDLAMPPLIVQAQPPRYRAIAYGDADALETALGLSLPRSACRAASTNGIDALWLGPDEFLLLANHPLTAEGLIDISHRQAGLEISGPHAATALNTGCPLDLHPSVFPTGACTRTLFGKAEIVLWRILPHRFHVETARSLLPYVVGLLREAAHGVT